MENATVSIRELKDKTSSIIDRVEKGEAITVTKHGRPVARIVSTSTPPHLTALIADGTERAPVGPRYLPVKPAKLKGEGKSAAEYSPRAGAELYFDTSALIKLLVDEPGEEEAP